MAQSLLDLEIWMRFKIKSGHINMVLLIHGFTGKNMH